MADTTTSTKSIKMIAEFGDGSEQIINQSDPTSTNLVAKINAFSNFAAANNIFISEKSSATITRIKSATLIEQNTTEYDLG